MYTVTLTNNAGCTSTTSVSGADNKGVAAPNLSYRQAQQSMCKGEDLSVFVDNNPPYPAGTIIISLAVQAVCAVNF